MLDADTKRRIDTCRDILVGKVPDPKSQVEQITIALIYKFMDDMDAEAEELGGSRSFFDGNYAKYGWAKLMAPNMGGFDVLALYSEAIQKMNENPGIPALFRDIFKNAYLPYRDPETLRSFLKEIDGFSYDHSERLGDAFEYLLSVLGSQGDAGQFRTPRHIIDFMVEVIDPKKNESVLDPACGTAGFLISAWKHILKHNTKERPGDQLTPDERANLAANIHGYDISPDMVRLSLVNMYLHGFTDPHIVEYDTLTSEERWNETADVILANPPFMSPKGGIKPHKRFSVQATRSEVLFVDYMAEHLSPQGRAAIVVPEGIIFQSGTAYRQLREMLVKTSLVAVVSLPAGVFQPYSGVKTSILILDKRLAKSCDSVLFVKVGNDGYGLGAQRRAVKGSDLPEAARVLREWMRDQFDEKSGLATRVERVRIGEGGEWNLSGERYCEISDRVSHFDLVPLGDVTNLYQPKTITSKEIQEQGPYPVFGANGIIGYFTEFNHDQPEVLITCRGATCGTINMSAPKSWVTGNAMVAQPKDARLDKQFLYYLLKATDLSSVITGAAQPQITRQSLAPFQIPLPPLSVQQEIVAEIEGYQKIIDGARLVVENYRPRIDVQTDWPRVALGEICIAIQNGYPVEQTDEPGEIKVTRIQTIADGTVDLDKTKWSNDTVPDDRLMLVGDILFSHINSIDHLAKTAIFLGASVPVAHGINLIRLQPKRDVVLPLFLLWSMKQEKFIKHAKTFAQRAVNQASIKVTDIRNMEIALPPLVKQQAIVAEIEAEHGLVNANKQLIERFEAKIKAAINRIWGGAE